MKKLIFLLLLLLFATPCFAQWNEARLTLGIVGGGSSGTVNYSALPSCMGAWRMNADGSTAETDRTANGNDLTVSAGDTIPQSATVPTGYSGYSRDFEAADFDHLYIADGTELDISGADAKLTIVAWVKLESVPGSGAFFGIVCKYDGTTDQRQYQLIITGTGSSQFKFAGNLSKDSTSGGTPASVVESDVTTYVGATWYHIALVYDDVDMRIYVDGVLRSTPTAKTNGIFNGNQQLRIGEFSGGGYNFDGQIDELGIFNDGLSAAQILDIYTNGLFGDKGAGD